MSSYTEQQENELLDYLIEITRVCRDIEDVWVLIDIARNRGDLEKYLPRFRGILKQTAKELLDISDKPLLAWGIEGHDGEINI